MAKHFQVDNAGTLLTGLVGHWKADEASGNMVDYYNASPLDLTLTGTVGAQTGKLSGARGGFPTAATNFFKRSSVLTVNRTIAWSLSFWVYRNASISTNQVILSTGGETNGSSYETRFGFFSSNKFRAYSEKLAVAALADALDANDFPLQTWTHVLVTHTTGSLMTLYINGSSVASDTEDASDASDGSLLMVGGYRYGGTDKNDATPDLWIDSLTYHSKVYSAQEISDMYNGGAGNDMTDATPVTVNPSAQVATFSIPAYTAKHGSTISPAAQVITASIPAYTVSLPKIVLPAAQVATFSVPAYTVTAESPNVTVSPSAQVATFSTPTPTILLDFTVAVAAQVATFSTPTPTISLGTGATILASALIGTFSIPAYTVSADRSIIVSVAAQLLTFSLPTLAKVGAIWRKIARSTSSIWSRVSRNST